MSFKSPEERRFERKALRDHRAFVKAVREGRIKAAMDALKQALV